MTIVLGSRASSLLCIHNFLFLSIPAVTALQVLYTGLQRASILQAQGDGIVRGSRVPCLAYQDSQLRFAASCWIVSVSTVLLCSMARL